MAHPLRLPKAAAATPAWPTFTGTATLVGTSSSAVTVYVDQTLGAQGMQNARDLLSGADSVVAQNNAFFAIAGGAVDVIVYALGGATDGTGGADHGGCDFTTGSAIEVDASFGSPNRVIGLFEAELSECAMNGNLCGYSTGEALSRWCATVVSSNALPDFATAPAWAQAGMPDWVNRTERTDQDSISTGCGMAFISWLLSQGHHLSQIAQAMVALGDAGTLATLYGRLTGDAATNAWPKFQSAVAALPGGVTTDDPFDGLPQAV
jgi:hypothetical protein